MARRTFKVEQRAVRDLKLVTDQLESAARIVDEAVGMCIGGIRVDDVLERADDRVVRRTFATLLVESENAVGASFTFVTSIVKALSTNCPPASVTRAVTMWLAALSKSSSTPSAT